MSIQRIDCAKKRTHGWQARATVDQTRRLTAFFADQAHGGKRAAHREAQAAEAQLWRKVRRMRKGGAR